MTIVNNTVNDCAMTVLPDAPIDPATGLPVPTILVGTDGNGTYSTSIIADSGTVYDIASDSTGTAVSVAFDGVSAVVTRSDGTAYIWDDAGAISADGASPDATYSTSSTPALLGTVSEVADKTFGSSTGLTILAENQATPASGMAAHITSSWNSGYQNGDIKGAFLSDTDDTDLVGGTDNDRSVNGNDLTVNGTVTRSPVATGADLVAYSGFSASNYLEQPYNADLDVGTGDICVMGWYKADAGSTSYLLQRKGTGGSGVDIGVRRNSSSGTMLITFFLGGTANSAVTTDEVASGVWFHIVAVRKAGVLQIYLNGVASGASAANTASVGSDQPMTVGSAAAGADKSNGDLALWRISATAPSASQISRIYNDEKHLFTEGAQATLAGTSDTVTALAHDDATDLLHVGTSAGRSVFQGLRRVSNTTTAVGTAISASNGLVVEE